MLLVLMPPWQPMTLSLQCGEKHRRNSQRYRGHISFYTRFFLFRLDDIDCSTIDYNPDYPGADDPTSATIRFKSAQRTTTEGGESIVFTLELLGTPPDGAQVTFDFTTIDDTATRSNDYTDTSGSGMLDATTNEFEITVPIVNDDVEETTERFYLQINNVQSSVDVNFLGDQQGEAIINDDDQDPVPVVFIRPGNYTAAEGNSVALIVDLIGEMQMVKQFHQL